MHCSAYSEGVKIADTWKPYRAYQTMMRFNSEWRDRAGTEALYQGGGRFGLVRIHSMEEDGRSVDFCVDRIPWPGLPVSLGWPLRDSFRIGASWDYLSIERGHWAGSPYTGWMLIFDPELIETFKATAQKLQNEPEAHRWKELRQCLIAWGKKEWSRMSTP